MEFIENYIPTSISYGSIGGPEFSTDITEVASGNEYRLIAKENPRRKYVITPVITKKEQLQDLIAFFCALRGKAHGFRFRDFADYYAINEEIAIGDGFQTEFQITKKYQAESLIYLRKITKIASQGLEVFIDGVKVNAFQLDANNGKIYFRLPPKAGAVITANFYFDVPVRFDQDNIEYQLETNNYYSVGEIKLIEIL